MSKQNGVGCIVIMVLLLSACSDIVSLFDLPSSFEAPSSIVLTGKPSFRIELGGFNGGESFGLQEIGFDLDTMGDMLGASAGANFSMYNWLSAPDNVQTFLLHYRLSMDMGNGSTPLTADDFSFNDPVVIPSTTVTIPAIDLPAIVLPPSSTGLSLPLVPEPSEGTALSDLASQFPGVVQSSYSMPLPDTGPQPLGLGSMAILTSATIGTGSLTITVTDGVDFSGVTISLTGGSAPETLAAPTVNGNQFTYSLAGKSVTKNTTIQMSGRITITKYVKTLNISIAPAISRFSRIVVTPTVPNPSPSNIPIPAVGGVKSITFSSVSLAMTITPPSGIGMTGFAPAINAPTIGLNNKTPTVNGDDLIFEATHGTDGLTLYLDSAYATEQGKPITSDIDIDVDLKLNGTAELALTNVAVSGTQDTDIPIGISVTPALTLFRAVIDPTALGVTSPISGTFPDSASGEQFDLSGLTSSLGETFSDLADRITFNDIKLMLYLDTKGIPSSLVEAITVRLVPQYTGSTDVANPQDLVETDGFDPAGHGATEDDPVYTGPLPEPSVSTDLTAVFNERPADFTIAYSLILPEKIAVRFSEIPNMPAAVYADIVITLPFKLNLLPAPGDPPDKAYVSLALSGLFEVSDEDMFGRTSAGDDIDRILENVKTVTLDITYTNTLGLAGVELCLLSRDYPGKAPVSFALGAGTKTTPILVSPDFLAYPFILAPEVHIAKSTGENYSTLELKNEANGEQTGIAVTKIRASVTTDVNYEITL
jgi:hypothetical protein